MNRREAIQSLSLISAHKLFPIILGGFVLSCKNEVPGRDHLLFFTSEEMEVVQKMIDLMIPVTNTQSASQVGTDLFLDEVFAKCMTSDQQTLIREGMAKFMPAFQSTDDVVSILRDLDQRAFQGQTDAVWFRPIKQYSLIGYFTSQEGTTKASNYVAIPGDYQGDIPSDSTTLNYGKTKLKFYL